MDRRYKHLNGEERGVIFAEHRRGASLRAIGLAHAATNRLQELLNSNAWTIETFNIDGTGKRLLATIKIAGEDVGDILIREGLARRWPNGNEFWCR